MEHNFITKGDEVFLLTEDTKTVSLPEAVGQLAMDTYGKMTELKDIADTDKRKSLEKMILFQTKVLNALSNACKATEKIRTGC